jgi:hypothetical protein
VLTQYRFDFSQFDAETSDFHLMVYPSQELNIAIG